MGSWTRNVEGKEITDSLARDGSKALFNGSSPTFGLTYILKEASLKLHTQTYGKE